MQVKFYSYKDKESLRFFKVPNEMHEPVVEVRREERKENFPYSIGVVQMDHQAFNRLYNPEDLREVKIYEYAAALQQVLNILV